MDWALSVDWTSPSRTEPRVLRWVGLRKQLACEDCRRGITRVNLSVNGRIILEWILTVWTVLSSDGSGVSCNSCERGNGPDEQLSICQ
jgi:hypothetical protein